MTKDIVPSNSRYIPFTQQPACCVTTCMQMVMYRHHIPLISAEELGYYLGLVVHPDRKNLFHNVRTSTKKPPGGYGTRIFLPEYEPNKVFKKLGIPLGFKLNLITDYRSAASLLSFLKSAERCDSDILLCFNHGALIDDPSKNWGHVCVFDHIIGKRIRIIDPSPDQPKWREVNPEKMYKAMQKHGEKRAAGTWELKVL